MIFVLNFKTYFKNSKKYLQHTEKLKKIKGVDYWLALNPYFYFTLAKKLKKDFKIGLQNLAPVFLKPQTGETVFNFEMINLADFVLIGHSERYRLGENKRIIKEKIKTLQNKKFKLLIFFSENSYNVPKIFKEVLEKTANNLKEFLSIINKRNYKKVYFVYEPWWAISTEEGRIPSSEFLNDFLNWYYKFTKKICDFTFPIFYGGSFNSKLAELYKNLGFDGYVLGKASTSIDELKLISKIFKKLSSKGSSCRI